MKKFFTILSVMMLAVSVSSCKFVRINIPKDIVLGGDKESSKTFEFDEIRALDLKVMADVNYTQNEDAPTVYITGSENAVEALSVAVKDGVLTIDSEKAVLNGRLDIVFNSKTLESVAIAGAADFKALSGIEADSFTFSVTGAGDALISGLKADKVVLTVKGAGDMDIREIKSETLSILIQGAGDISVNGETDHVDMLIQGAGSIDAYGLKYNSLQKDIQGAGSIGLM